MLKPALKFLLKKIICYQGKGPSIYYVCNEGVCQNRYFAYGCVWWGGGPDIGTLIAELNPGQSFDTDLSRQRLHVQNVQYQTTLDLLYDLWKRHSTHTLVLAAKPDRRTDRHEKLGNNLLYGSINNFPDDLKPMI